MPEPAGAKSSIGTPGGVCTAASCSAVSTTPLLENCFMYAGQDGDAYPEWAPVPFRGAITCTPPAADATGAAKRQVERAVIDAIKHLPSEIEHEIDHTIRHELGFGTLIGASAIIGRFAGFILVLLQGCFLRKPPAPQSQ